MGSKKVHAIVCDLEYTCFDKISGDVICVGLVEVLEDFTIGRYKAFYSRPRSVKYFTDKANEVHKISFFKAMYFPRPRKNCIEILHWLAPLKDQFRIPLVFHSNGQSDWRWMESHFEKEGLVNSIRKVFCDELNVSTLKMARENLVHLENHKLETICEHYNFDLDAHEVLSDALGCAHIYIKMMKKEDIWTGRLL